jgi:hypothetical protein
MLLLIVISSMPIVGSTAFDDEPQFASSYMKTPPRYNGIGCERVTDCTLYAGCMNCSFPKNCNYGTVVNVTCTSNIHCANNHSIRRETICRYCYQTEHWEYDCGSPTNCSVSAAPPRSLQTTVCRVKEHVICLGRRSFYKRVRCNWTSGYKWSTAMLLSVTLGGFGVDRFYLGLWKSGIGKLFSFGGLGVWTLIDVVLIATGYIGPADGSLLM